MYCLVGLLPTFVIETIVNFLQWYDIACRSKEFTENTLNVMEEKMRRYVLELLILYVSWFILTIYSFLNWKTAK